MRETERERVRENEKETERERERDRQIYRQEERLESEKDTLIDKIAQTDISKEKIIVERREIEGKGWRKRQKDILRERRD